MRHDYKTNVRELDALLWKSMLMEPDPDIAEDRLRVPPELESKKTQPDEPSADAIDAIDDTDDLMDGVGKEPDPVEDAAVAAKYPRAEVHLTLVMNCWKRGPTAKALGLTRYQLYRLIRKYRLKPE